MRLEVISQNSKFAFLPELEPVFGVVNLLNSQDVNSLCTNLYGTEQIASWKSHYRFLFEIFNTVGQRNPYGMMEFLLDQSLEGMTLEKYQEAILTLPAEDFLWRHLELHFVPGSTKKEIRDALTDDVTLYRVYAWVAKDCPSFLAFSAFVRQSRLYIEEYFSLAKELQTPALDNTLKALEPQVEQMLQEVRSGVQELGAFDFSQKQMGKTFHNQGPYEEFVFIPSYLMPSRACRFFHVEEESKRQFLFMTLRNACRGREDTLRTLKAVADGTRYQILTLLAEEGPLRGLDIAKKVSISTSTVSHHMDQLKEGGLITEEQVKNSKYYGLNHNNVTAFLAELEKDLGIQ